MIAQLITTLPQPKHTQLQGSRGLLVACFIMKRLISVLNVEEGGEHESRPNIVSTVIHKGTLRHCYEITSSLAVHLEWVVCNVCVCVCVCVYGDVCVCMLYDIYCNTCACYTKTVTYLNSAQTSTIICHVFLKVTPDEIKPCRGAIQILNEHGNLKTSPQAPFSGNILREYILLHSEGVISVATGYIQIQATTKTLGKISIKETPLN